MRKDNEIEVIRALKKYKVALQMIDLYEKGCIELESKLSKEQLRMFYYDVSYMQSILSGLETYIKDFIINQYISNDDNKWWVDSYSKSTYYRHKTQAINQFLKLYNDETKSLYLH